MKILSTKKNIIKTLLTMIIMVVFCSTYIFANDFSMDSLGISSIFMHELLSFLSWGWILFATLAGKLMTNEFVYGSFINLDVFLWKMRNIMKNFANFTLGAFVLWSILKSLFTGFSKDEAISQPSKIIKSALVAGILIQSSWFIVGAIMDISTIAVSAVGAFPAQFMQDKKQDHAFFTSELTKFRKESIVFDIQGDTHNKIQTQEKQTSDGNAVLEQKEMLNEFMDFILPSHDNIGGPLIFMGMSIFKFYDVTNIEVAKISGWSGLFKSTMINLMMILAFSIAMILLFIINLFRVLVLWILIAFSPMIILFVVMEKMGAIKESPLKSANLERLSIDKIISLIFKPVLYIAYMSLMLIFVLGIRQILKPSSTSNDQTIWLNESISLRTTSEIDGSVGTSTIEIPDLVETTIEGFQNTFSQLIVYLFTLFLIWKLIMIAASGSPDFINNMVKGLDSVAKAGLQSIPLVPTGMKDENGQTERLSANEMKGLMEGFQSDSNVDFFAGDFDRTNKGTGALRDALGLTNAYNKYDNEFEASFNNSNIKTGFNSFRVVAQKMAQEVNARRNSGLTITNTNRANYLKRFITKYHDQVQIDPKFNNVPSMNNDESILDYFGRLAIDQQRALVGIIENRNVDQNNWQVLKDMNNYKRFGGQ